MDHPREYGENFVKWHCRRGWPGSSPRIRGECLVLHDVQRPVGIIPANTGRIISALLVAAHRTDHPREYGENNWACTKARMGSGSSPRIRGELLVVKVVSHQRGIIPANTGRIIPDFHTHLIVRDHPREYGENQIAGSWFPSG